MKFARLTKKVFQTSNAKLKTIIIAIENTSVYNILGIINNELNGAGYTHSTDGHGRRPRQDVSRVSLQTTPTAVVGVVD